ncbi:MAG TPA: DNA mismatch repair protein MutS, partial [Myxococcales bacterium]|nr:DNA mismatch repair protein MutS [Myxococcales bacterium]
MSEPVQLVSETAATPMLRQYQEAKAQAKDALLLFRLGDFYELFYEDARLAAQLLGIALTSRAKGDERIPMAGVPYHAAKAYVGKLVGAGYKVALCDQVEVPGPGKQLVRREIVRLVTPGTLFDDDDAREPVWLGAMIVERDRAALALLDASTGELRSLQPGNFESILDELQRARPRELLVAEELLGTPPAEAARRASGAVRLEGRALRAPGEAQRFLQRHLGVATLDGFG